MVSRTLQKPCPSLGERWTLCPWVGLDGPYSTSKNRSLKAGQLPPGYFSPSKHPLWRSEPLNESRGPKVILLETSHGDTTKRPRNVLEEPQQQCRDQSEDQGLPGCKTGGDAKKTPGNQDKYFNAIFLKSLSKQSKSVVDKTS